MNKPKLELQINVPATIKLLMNKPVIGNNAFGNWYLFGVEHEGQEFSFFATEEVYKFASDNNLHKGDVVKITKTLVKNGKKNQTAYHLEVLNRANQSHPVTTGNGHAVNNRNSHTNDRGTRNGNGKGQHIDDYGIMRECLTQGIKLQHDLGSVIDVNRIAITLFITRTKANNGSFLNY